MNRLLLTFALTFLCYVSQAQLIMIDGETGEYRYEDVVTADGITKGQILERAQKWLSSYYQPIDSVRMDSSGVYQKSTYRFSWKFIKKNIPIQLFFDVTIQSKDNRYKYDFSHFEMGKVSNGIIDAYALKTYIERFPSKYQIYIEEPIDSEITKAISSLEFYILHGKMEADDEDW